MDPSHRQEPTARELFEVLIREHGDVLLASIRATAGAEHAEDIFQDTVLVAWRRLADYDRTRPFGPWLRGIARMIALDQASRRGRVQLASPEVIEQIEQDLRAFEQWNGSAAEVAFTFRERLASLDDCLSRLSAQQSEVIRAVYRDSFTIASIARTTGENEETLKKRLQRARALLADCLDSKGTFGEGALA